MPDIAHWWGGDIGASPSGDLALVDGILLGNQRVVRRLMTCANEYIWHMNYGGSIPQRIGLVLRADVISAMVRSQIFLEAVVARTPVPVITIAPIPNGVVVYVQYYDKSAQKIVTVSFPIYARPVSLSLQDSIQVQTPGSIS